VVDGGIGPSTVRSAVSAGAGALVAGNAIFSHAKPTAGQGVAAPAEPSFDARVGIYRSAIDALRVEVRA
jgi:hypothetical protein